jgi:hypothetical protein
MWPQDLRRKALVILFDGETNTNYLCHTKPSIYKTADRL